MCGISGFLNKHWSQDQLQAMTDCLAHRGPDSGGIYYDASAGVALGHRRLSILDLSPAGNQPYFSQDGRYIMIYNGEVYNFREIAVKYSIPTKSHSDTEVIIEGFARIGTDIFSELNGMFSIAIWDKIDERLFIARDRVGIKPLYYHFEKGSFAFASELKSLFSLPIGTELNNDSIYNFLHLGYIPGEQTIYNAFKKLKPGHYAVVTSTGMDIHAYWRLEDILQDRVITDEKSALKELKLLVESSVNYSLISDVPLGIFLSGGVDSSLVAAVAQASSAIPVKTFSIGFKDGKFNESGYAQKVADHIRSSHHQFTVTEDDAVGLVEGLLDVYDEPYADSSAIPTMLVSKLARQEVTVALSGDGGDELFMGYGFYYWARRLQQPAMKMFRKPISAALRLTGKNRSVRASKMFDYPVGRRKSHIFSQEQYYFASSEIDDLLLKPGRLSIEEDLDYKGRKLSWAEEQSFFDIKNYLPEELLVKTDRASMKYSLEVRVPLLDHRMVEFAVNLSEDLKLRGNTGKYLLKEVLYQYVPQEIFNRPKWGFAVPLASWLKGELNYLLTKYLDPKVITEAGIVDARKVELLKQEFMNGKDYYFTRIWALIILHKWLSEKKR